MRGWLHLYRRSCRTYLLVVPLLLYLGLMYRLLETSCLDPDRASQQRGASVYIQPDVPARRIMQLSHHNDTSVILELAKEYENLEQQRKRILQSLVRMLNVDTVDNKDTINMNRLKQALEHKPDYDREKITVPTYTGGEAQDGVIAPRYLINCTNVHEIKLKTKIGHGVSKQTLKGDFNGLPVAVKMVTRHQSEVKGCIEKINEDHQQKDELRSRCFVFPTMKLMKEILLLEQLSHKGFAQLLGYCIRNEESDTPDLHERGIVSVFELGERLMINNIQTFTWQQRIKHAIDLADFLDYLEHSPLGSLRVRDFKEEHFLMINGSLKMIDLDDVDNLEPSCSTYVNIETQSEFQKYGKASECEFNLLCQRGLCLGFNARQNMKYMNRIFFKRLLFPTVFPKILAQETGAILADIDDNKLSAEQLRNKLTDLLENMFSV